MIKVNSLLLLDTEYLSGEFRIGSRYVIVEIIKIVYVKRKKNEKDHRPEKVTKNMSYNL